MSFEEVILEAIDECFSWIGEKEKESIYFFLEIKYNIKKQEIPYRIDDFAEAIDDIFGIGAKLLEIRIMKNLYSKMEYISPHFHAQESLEFTKYVEATRIKVKRRLPMVTCAQL